MTMRKWLSTLVALLIPGAGSVASSTLSAQQSPERQVQVFTVISGDKDGGVKRTEYTIYRPATRVRHDPEWDDTIASEEIRLPEPDLDDVRLKAINADDDGKVRMAEGNFGAGLTFIRRDAKGDDQPTPDESGPLRRMRKRL